MEDTSQTLLDAAKCGVAEGWERLDKLYRPFIYTWLRGNDVAHQDADELAQATMAVVMQKLADFEHSGRAGAFRTWVRRIMAFEIKRHWRDESTRNRHLGERGCTIQHLESVADERNELVARWDREHDMHVLAQLLQEVTPEFSPTTIMAFRKSAIDEQPVSEVALELNLTEGAVYIARSRVLKRLREVAAELL